uniref:Protein kinase domain-containing protein n=1 Tax=Myripristis murdjan TaxID=586833 RepID=A0A667WLL8_9TELE
MCVCVCVCAGVCVSPEVVKNEPYGEKADIWALGCILYQMATLQPPFYSSNMLSLASKIVEAVYEPLEEGAFSDRVTDMIKWCLSPDADLRPDIVAVSSRISDLMMRQMDTLYTSQHALERKAERDRKRAQKYFLERHKCTCIHNHTFFLAFSLLSSLFSLLSLFSEMILLPQRSNQGQSGNVSICISSTTGLEYAEFIQVLNIWASDMKQHKEQMMLKNLERLKGLKVNNGVGVDVTPVSAGICVSQRKVRQIDDPIQRLLVQMHKIIFITQLPPAPHNSVKRRIVERFKKSLFHQGSDPYNLKVELSKVTAGPPPTQVELTSAAFSLRHITHTKQHSTSRDPTVAIVAEK